MEKGLICIALLVMIIFAGCKKEGSPSNDDDQYVIGYTRVLGINHTSKDTSATPYMKGRVETTTILAFDEDPKMRAELINYQYLAGGKALYTVQAINKTDCQQLVRWHWIGGLLVDSIIPTDDAVYAHDTTVFKVYGTATTGAITLNAQAVDPSPNSCGNSRTLQLLITQAILPITYTSKTVKREGDKMVVNWNTETPQEVDQFLIMWSIDGNPANEVCKYMLDSDPGKKKYTITYPAIKKTK